MKIEISVSASRKLNRQLYGGAPFESSDVFLCLKQEVEVDNDNDLAVKTLHLQELCDNMLAAEVVKTQTEIQNTGRN